MTRPPLRLWSLLAVFLLAAISGETATAQVATPPYGQTWCRGDSIWVYINPKVDTLGRRDEVVAHEQAHVEQIQRLGCEGFRTVILSQRGLIRLEIEAFCASKPFAMRRGRTSVHVRNEYAYAMSQRLDLDVVEVGLALRESCP